MEGRSLWFSVPFTFLLAVAMVEGSEGDAQQRCPAVHLQPGIPGTCSVSHHCSKVTCLVTDPLHKHSTTVIVKINGCDYPPRAKVSLIQTESSINWSHQFQDGEMAILPVTAESITGVTGSVGPKYLKVGLKLSGTNVNVTLVLVGSTTSTSVNVTLLEGEMSLLSGECGEDQSYSFDSQDADEYNGGEYFNTEECRDIYLPRDLVERCNVTEHCTKLACVSPPEEQMSQTFTLKVNTCEYPPTATVTYKTPAMPTAWSHTFDDGEQAKIPVALPGYPSVIVFLKVTLNTTEDERVNFLLQLIGQSEMSGQDAQPFTVRLLQGGLPLQPCSEEHAYDSSSSSSSVRNLGDGKCPRVQLGPGILATCVASSHCSKVTCTISDGVSSHKLTITVKIKRCHGLVTADVSFKQKASDLDWSHTFKDGEKAKLPAGPGSITGEKATGAEMYLKVTLEKMGRYLRFELRITGEMKSDEVTSAVDTPLLDGKVPFASLKCDGDAWFTSQPGYIKALVIGGPILLTLLLVVLALFCCIRHRGRPLKFNVRSPSGSKVPMQPLINQA